jgi:hypothetical protein
MNRRRDAGVERSDDGRRERADSGIEYINGMLENCR